MQIRFLNGPKKGQTAHAARDASTQLLIDAGLVEEVQGVKTSEDVGIQLHGTQHIIPPTVVEITWGIKPLPYSSDGKPTVVRQYFSEFTWYAMPPKECPKEVAERFKAALKRWEYQKKANSDAREQAVVQRW